MSGLMQHADVLVLGGGIAGLGAAWRAREQGREALVCEARERAGGLLDHFSVDGFRFDNAVHLSFATEPRVRELFDRTPSITHPADARCFETDRWLKHPVQNNLHPLPAADKVALLKSFLARPDTLTGADYEAWLRHQYGDAIAERYPLRYTRKYWATPAQELGTAWIGPRMRRAELDEVLLGLFSDDTPHAYYTKEMRYPKQGGYRAFIEPLIAETRFLYAHRAVAIDPQQRRVRFDNGAEIGYETLVSSLPLPLMPQLIEGMPREVAADAQSLRATSIDLVSVGLRRPLVKDLWFYIYDEDILASRAYSPSVKSPDAAPAGCSSLQFEVYSRGPQSAYAPAQLLDNTRLALQRMGIAEAADIAVLHHKHLPWGNVIFDSGMEARRDRVRHWLRESAGLRTCGRFGEWDYLWSNQSLLSGHAALD